MPSQAAITNAYIKHALKLIRVGNGLVYDANIEMRKLSKDLKKLLNGEDLASLGIVALRKIIAQADKLIYNALGNVGNNQDAATAALVQMEHDWAVKIGQYDEAATDAAIARAIGNFTVYGNTMDDHMAVIAQRLSNQVEAQIRLGAASGQSDSDILARIVGNASLNSGGVMDTARRNVGSIVDGATHSAADIGRRAAQKANGIDGMLWHAILDENVCIDCAARDGKVWTIDGDPIGDAPQWLPAPIHPRCRCLVVPLDIPSDMNIEDYADQSTDNFANWLETLDKDEQNDLMGHGRADLWRDDKIGLGDLIGQNGLVIPLSELKDSIDNG